MSTLAEASETTPKRRALATAEDVSRILKTPVSSVYELGRRGELPGCIRLGRRMRFDLDVLERFIASGGATGER